MVALSPFVADVAALVDHTILTAPEQIEKMQPGFYLPILLDHKGLQVAYPVQESTTWPQLACFVKRVSESRQCTDVAAILTLPDRNMAVTALANALVRGVHSALERKLLNEKAILRNHDLVLLEPMEDHRGACLG